MAFAGRDAQATAAQQDGEVIGDEVTRTLSMAEIEGIKAALGAVNDQTGQLKAEGMSRMSFFLGSLNVMATTFVLAKFPQWLWVMYGIKCLFLIPAWVIKMSQVHHGALFVLDFCWVINISFGIYMLLSIFGAVPESLQLSAFLTFFACSLGPLGWACIVLHNGLVFHSIERITSLFIHMTPTLVAWSVIYYPDEVAKSWPGRFPGTDELEAVSILRVPLHGIAVYFLWLLLHALWLLSVGVDCPAKGHNTVFDDMYRKQGLGQLFEQKTGLKGIRSHAALYLLIHGSAVTFTFSWAAICFKFVIVHMLFGLALVVSAAWNGAGYYEYIFAKKYTKVVQQLLKDREP
mmetsp:Transcript_2843/g.6487  ORF Transcript_2843/g.6487 Transcript_2843/m.6487 type:complete len:347 (+) Transcript_2843:40-1080(+)